MKKFSNDDDAYDYFYLKYLEKCEELDDELEPVIASDDIGLYEYGEELCRYVGEKYVTEIKKDVKIEVSADISDIDGNEHILLMETLVEELSHFTTRKFYKTYIDIDEKEITYSIDVQPSAKLELFVSENNQHNYVLTIIGKVKLV